MKRFKDIYFLLASLCLIIGCVHHSQDGENNEIADVAANEDVARYMESFKGLGALTDSTSPTKAQEAIRHFKYADDLKMELVLAEPNIVQPVEISFDHKGRMWVVQYHQYPYPKGLKVVSVDNYLRVNFDKVPLAPPSGTKGADKITIFEDTDADGVFDKSIDAIKGLNIATSVTTGLGKIWVLNPPYLLAYPDKNDDGLPDGQPEVVMEGFGLEDTHAVANSLTWGPDGWLYGGQGSTTTANINSAVSKNVAFSGQVIWRYHPASKVFEVFAEGGGNTFNVEFDSKGRLFSGNNAYDRGPNFKQGGFYPRSLGKHGPYTNSYTFGNLDNMKLEGERKRFTHSLIRYEGNALPSRFFGKFIALNPLLNYVQLTRIEADGSTLKNIDEGRVIETDDHWFRPVNIKMGPDGAVYIADWYDSRLSHVDPRDTWHKTSGRIYRLQSKTAQATVQKFDLSKYNNQQLLSLLGDKNKWFRQQALRQFANRKDLSLVPQLTKILTTSTDQKALEALWAINLSGGYTEDIALLSLKHTDPFVRLWAIRLIGDENKVSKAIQTALINLAENEKNVEVRSQLAASSKRFKGEFSIAILKNLIMHHEDSKDPDIPFQLWWAIESKVESDRKELIELFSNRTFWDRPVVQNFLSQRLMQRYVLAGGTSNYETAATLIQQVPAKKYAPILLAGLREGLRGKDIASLSPQLTEAIHPYQSSLFGAPLILGVRQGNAAAVTKALTVIADENQNLDHRLAYIQAFGEKPVKAAQPVLLKIVANAQTTGALKENALYALQVYNDPTIGKEVVKAYPQIRSDLGLRNAAIDLFSSRKTWALDFLDAIETSKRISKLDVIDQLAKRFKLLNDPEISKKVELLWPKVKQASMEEKKESIQRFSKLIKTDQGDLTRGKTLFAINCGICHRLDKDGGTIGPDLTGYERSNMNTMLLNIVDPNADIREGYVMHRITTNDGRILEGKIEHKEGDLITFQSITGRQFKLAASAIKELKAQAKSSMPERILDHLSDQEIKDIFSYIMKK